MIFDDFIKSELDLETVSLFLSEVLEKEKENVQKNPNYTSSIGKALLDKDSEHYSILSTCKDNVDFVIQVLKDYIEQENIQSKAPFSYKPRKFISHSDLGKHQTEVLKAKRVIDHSLWTASVKKDEERINLYQECINKLNYVYSHIARRT